MPRKPRGMSRCGKRSERGAASVELIAVIPLLALAVLLTAQLALAGGALWSAGIAARAGARAANVGGDPEAAARRALPGALREGAKVEDGDAVRVRVSIPRLIPWLPRVNVDARTSLQAGDG
jgi:hypothetical protein